ncbi:putative membrane protein [Helicobacter pylori Hp P-23]|nr:putative membrane protein [Helicobacter pylori Hp P-23]
MFSSLWYEAHFGIFGVLPVCFSSCALVFINAVNSLNKS